MIQNENDKNILSAVKILQKKLKDSNHYGTSHVNRKGFLTEICPCDSFPNRRLPSNAGAVENDASPMRGNARSSCVLAIARASPAALPELSITQFLNRSTMRND